MLVPVLSTALAVPFADGNSAMFANADAAFPAGPVIGSGPNRLDPAVIASRMQEVLDRLASGGCTTTALEYQAHVAGAYLNGSVVGMSDTTTATGTVDGTLRQFRATLAGEGEIGSVFSTFDSGRLVADLDAGGFVVGRFIRVNGRRGIFVAAMGSCDGGATAAEALASWYEGDLSGWTTWDGQRVFTPCGAVGAFGPSQEACDTHYLGTPLSGEVTVVGGLQHWTAPFDGTYRIEAFGAQGASGSDGVDGHVGGRGARMRGDFPLLAGDTLVIGVGQMGTRYVCNGSGGGASFVTTGGGAPLLVAGGGGGIRESVSQNGCDAQPMEMGGTASGSAETHGCGLKAASTTGTGGLVSLPSWGSGGGAMFEGGHGEYGIGALGGQSLASSAIGGYNPFDDAAHGGFGGGGSGNGNCGGGGGGGYSGGDGGRVAGAGGSFNSGGNPSNSGGERSGNGLVTIDRL